MPGAHVARRPRAAPDSASPPPQRNDRSPHPSGVGWWRPPTKRRADADEPARHRVVQDTDVLTPVATSAGRPDVGARPGRRKGHRRPISSAPRRARRRRIVRRTVLGSVAAVVLGPVLAFALGYLLFSVPNPDDAVNNQVALVSFADGSQLTRLVPEQGNRVKVPLDAVPAHVRDAVLAAEDRSFYSNPGFDLTGMVRAAWNQVQGGSGGGSTITQQFVKKALVGDEQTLWRKFTEVILAVKISQERSKVQILADYLNTIYFGRGAYGIQSASQAYFGKDVGNLSTTEGALLAGLIQSPSRWDPAISPERAVQRWTFVLDGMVTLGTLDPAERAAALFPPTASRRSATGGTPGDNRGHIVTAVTAELEELGISEQDLAQEGLRITTTIDPTRQQQAVDAAHDALTGQPVNLRSAMVAIDPGTGGVLAYYGGDNGLGLDYARTRRLAGSTFKPFVVLAGLQQDPPVGLGEIFDGEEVPGLRNAAGADCDRCDLKQAMTVSNNVVFNTLAKKVGAESVAEAARSAGITAPLDNPNEGIALGNKEVNAFELASAYATLAAGGIWHQPHLVTSVVTSDDRVLYQAATEGERRFPERVARNVTESMLDVAARDGLALPGGRPVAAKTGTVQSRFEGQNNDAWMSGFTPMVSASVWMGTDMNSPIRTAAGTPISGASLPGEVWKEFMAEAHEDEPVEQFAPFRPIGEAPATGPEDSESDSADAAPAPAPPVQDPAAAPPPGPTPPPAVPGADPAAGAPPQDPRAAPGAAEPGPAPVFGPPEATPAPQCTLTTPCG